MWRKRNPFALLVGMQIGVATVECSIEIPNFLRYLKKLKMELPYDPAIPLLGIYPKFCTIQIEKYPISEDLS